MGSKFVEKVKSAVPGGVVESCPKTGAPKHLKATPQNSVGRVLARARALPSKIHNSLICDEKRHLKAPKTSSKSFSNRSRGPPGRYCKAALILLRKNIEKRVPKGILLFGKKPSFFIFVRFRSQLGHPTCKIDEKCYKNETSRHKIDGKWHPMLVLFT